MVDRQDPSQSEFNIVITSIQQVQLFVYFISKFISKKKAGIFRNEQNRKYNERQTLKQ